MKFVLFVEGHTERACIPAFLKRWLDPQLRQKVGIQPVRFEGCKDFDKGLRTKAYMHLDGPARDDIIAVIGLLDLYGPHIYPRHLSSAHDRYAWGVRHYEQRVGRHNFRMFFAVHELEAWLLSQPALLPQAVQSVLPERVVQPENMNFHEPPAKLLDRLYQASTGRGYKKTVYGKELFGRLDPAIAAQKCPHLQSMLQEMLRLAQAAGL